MRHKAGAMTPEQKLGKARVSASKLCNSSILCAIMAAVFLVISPLPGSAPVAAVIAAVLGAMGLVGLAKAGPGPRNLSEASPIERVGARMARTAKGKGVTGLVVGVLIIGLYVVIVLAARSEKEKRRERVRDAMERFQRQVDDLGRRGVPDTK